MAGRGTTATVALERAGIPFGLHEYAHDPRHESYGREATEAISVLNTRSAATPRASLASRPYEEARGSCAYSCTVNAIPARSRATVAVVPRPATIGTLRHGTGPGENH